jgi:hypothetical protein
MDDEHERTNSLSDPLDEEHLSHSAGLTDKVFAIQSRIQGRRVATSVKNRKLTLLKDLPAGLFLVLPVIADSHSISEAATRSGISRSTLDGWIKSLDHLLIAWTGEHLLGKKTGGNVPFTATGRAIVRRCCDITEDISNLSKDLQLLSEDNRTSLTIHCALLALPLVSVAAENFKNKYGASTDIEVVKMRTSQFPECLYEREASLALAAVIQHGDELLINGDPTPIKDLAYVRLHEDTACVLTTEDNTELRSCADKNDGYLIETDLFNQKVLLQKRGFMRDMAEKAFSKHLSKTISLDKLCMIQDIDDFHFAVDTLRLGLAKGCMIILTSIKDSTKRAESLVSTMRAVPNALQQHGLVTIPLKGGFEDIKAVTGLFALKERIEFLRGHDPSHLILEYWTAFEKIAVQKEYV